MKQLNILFIIFLVFFTPASATTTIAFYGDSNTAGNVRLYSFRNELYNKLTDNNYDFNFVGIKTTAGDTCLDKNHNGIPGAQITYFNTNIGYYLNKSPANIIVINGLVTNNIFKNNNVANTPLLMSSLIDDISSKAPNSLIFVSSLLPQIDNTSTTKINEYDATVWYNSALPSLISTKQQEGKKVYFIDVFNEAGFDLAVDYSKWDRLHPLNSGYDKMATVIYNHIKDSISKKPEATETPIVTPIITPTNIIQNGDFTFSTMPWTFYTNGKGSVRTIYSLPIGFVSMIKIDIAGTNTQFSQNNIQLTSGKKYRLNFSAYSNTGHDIGFKFLKQVSPFTVYTPLKVADLSTSWRNYSFEFVPSGFSGSISNARFMFWLYPYSKAGDIYYIDNVSLTQVI